MIDEASPIDRTADCCFCCHVRTDISVERSTCQLLSVIPTVCLGQNFHSDISIFRPLYVSEVHIYTAFLTACASYNISGRR